MKGKIDEHTDAKFHGGDAECTDGASQNERYMLPFAVDSADHGEADTAREYHARVRIAAPEDLHGAVSYAAKKELHGQDHACLRVSAEAKGMESGTDHTPDAPSFACAQARSHAMAPERPPISSISPKRTASSPSRMEPTSVAISSVRKVSRLSASSVMEE